MPIVGPEKLVKLQQQGEGIRNVREIIFTNSSTDEATADTS